MIEKVARALARVSWDKGGNEHAAEQFVDRRWVHYTKEARAAIDAMREPTAEMVDEGNDARIVGRSIDENTRATWHHMIEGALKGDEDGSA